MNTVSPPDGTSTGRASGRAEMSDLTRPDGRAGGEALAGGRSPLARVLLALITVYRWTATFRQPRCRFHPTCSAYATESIQVHGALRGSVYAVRRIGRCHPWNPGGVDHVPPPRK